MQKVTLLGYGTGNGSSNPGCGDAPKYLQQSAACSSLLKKYNVSWGEIFVPANQHIAPSDRPTITSLAQHLAEAVQQTLAKKEFFLVIGGDHSSGIGTWSGAAESYRHQGDIGLIWFDAHLDAHTYETTPSGNIHGMPVACLLGYGHPDLTSVGSSQPKIKPENLVFIGARSYEDGEHTLLQELGVKIYYMNNIKKQGLMSIFKEAIMHVKRNTVAYGVSLDIDGIDPKEAPGVGTPAQDGVAAQELINVISLLRHDHNFIGAELVEFNPHIDIEHKTETITLNLLEELLQTQ